MNYMCLQIDFSNCDDILIFMHYGIPSPTNDRLAIVMYLPISHLPTYKAVSSPDHYCHLLPIYTVPSVMRTKCCF